MYFMKGLLFIIMLSVIQASLHSNNQNHSHWLVDLINLMEVL